LVVSVARTRLVQALVNILQNAAESYYEADIAKPIRVVAKHQRGLVVITVEDRGCGMSDEVQRDALTLFATNKPNGTGFGLPLAVKIIESEHGGRLTLESAKGRGTLVRITVPANTQTDAP